MNNQIKYSLAGFCMGVAELIPGISGATVAVIFKIYPNLMTILSRLRFKNLTLNLQSLSTSLLSHCGLLASGLYQWSVTENHVFCF